ncbi:MAG TPA: hypothetical protein VEL28_13610 [Candidatus Binatia bacterium]|nr:hypothetical protein [Candidatus Binatia bacterium]
MRHPAIPAVRLVVAGVVAILSIPAVAAALTSDQASCRDAIARAMSGYARTTGQIVASCHRQRSAGDLPASVDCNDVDDADQTGRLSSERASVRSSIGSACGSSSALLGDQYAACPAPAQASDDGGDSTGLDDFEEVAECLISLNDLGIGAMSLAALGDPDGALEDNPAKCQATLGKLTAGILKAYLGEGRKCQRRLDGGTSSDAFGCESVTSSAKVTNTRSKFHTKFSKACVLPQERLATLNACAERFDELETCSLSAAETAGLGLVRHIYELDGDTPVTTTIVDPPTTTTEAPPTTTTLEPTTTTTLGDTVCGDSAPTCNGSCPDGQTCQDVAGECSCIVAGEGACAPATIRRVIHGKHSSSPPTATSLSTGWSGTAHDVDIPDNTGDVVDVTCDANCENCNVNLNVQEGNPASNCRCAANPQQTCTVINGPDSTNCAGIDTTCQCYFGSPLAISSGGTPVCVVNRITEDYDGSMNLRTGEWDVRIKLSSVVHLGIDTVHPCPLCNNDDVANDGIRNGTCSGGLSSGACDVNGDHLTFGPTSFDCMPNSATNISGSGLTIDLKTSSQPQSLPANLPCDSPAGSMCPCRVCSGNSNVGCSSDADCIELNAGTCTAGGGAGIQPNQCDEFLCGEDSFCSIGPIDKYCDGVTHPDGRGFLSCTTDLDCSANGHGACTISDLRRCYTDPIQVDGVADPFNPVTGAIFCIPPTTSPAVNVTGGIPGPGVFVLDFSSDVRCKSDPNLVYEFPDGANCGTTATTTSTTLLPPLECETATAPACGGTCDGGQVCTDNGGVCECTDPPIPSCQDATSPACGGTCPEGQVCVDSGGTCGCTSVPLPACSAAAAPACGGVCPLGQVCTAAGSVCGCTGL